MANDLSRQFAQLKTENGEPRTDAGAGAGVEARVRQSGDLRAQLRTTAESNGGSRVNLEQVVPEVVLEEEEPTEATDEEAEYFDETPTPAIDVPGQHSADPPFAGIYHEGGYFDESSLATFMSERSSISFDTHVKLEDGAQLALDAPLPKLSVTTRPRGRSLLEEIQKREMQRQISRARSETDREEYDPDTGERMDQEKDYPRDGRYVVHQPRWPFLQSTVDDMAVHDKERRPGREHSESLTSRTTASPVLEEVLTPISDNAETIVSPLAIPSPPSQDWYGPASAEQPRRLTAAARSKSFGLERRTSRRISRRSTSNSISPATAFLSRYLPSSPPAAPDGEGQEVGDYVLGREIGFGGFSIIREASTIVDGTRLSRAVKIVRRQVPGRGEAENETLQAEYDHEISLWRCLQHEHILPLFAVWETDFATFAFTHLNTGGTLFDAVRRNRSGLPPHLARRFAYQVASALRYLHEDMRIVHRDVKLENCLVDASGPDAAETGGKILLCDFGLADYMNGEDQAAVLSKAAGPHLPQGSAGDASSLSHVMGPSDTSTNIAGSLPYASPEMLGSHAAPPTPHADMWAFGVVCYALAVGKLPFQHAFAPRVRMMILGGEFDRDALELKERAATAAATNGSGFESDRRLGAGEQCMVGVGELVTACLRRSLRKRWTIHQCLDSDWLGPEAEEAEKQGLWMT